MRIREWCKPALTESQKSALRLAISLMRTVPRRRTREREGKRRRDRIARTLLTCGSSPRGYVVTFTMSVFVVAPASADRRRRWSAGLGVHDRRSSYARLQGSAALGRHPLVVSRNAYDTLIVSRCRYFVLLLIASCEFPF